LVAAQYARRALALDPDLPEAHLVLGDALLQLEQVPEALHHLDVAGLLKPQDPSLRKTLADMASKDPDPGIRQGAQAVQLDLEAASDAGAGRYEQAAATAARAARFAAAAQMPDLAADIAARGQRYSRQRPWRDPP
jgi:predicted Zn-dependent protease